MPICRSMCGHINALLLWIDGCRSCFANTCHLPIMLRSASKLDVVFSKYPKPMGCTSYFINNSGYIGKNWGRVPIVTLTHLKKPGRGHNPLHSRTSTLEDSQLRALCMWNIELIWFLWIGGPLRKSLPRKKKWWEISIFGPAVVAKKSQNTSSERGTLSLSKANFGHKTLSPIMSPLLRIQKPNSWSFVKPLRPNLWDTQMEVVMKRFFISVALGRAKVSKPGQNCNKMWVFMCNIKRTTTMSEPFLLPSSPPPPIEPSSVRGQAATSLQDWTLACLFF